MTISSSTRKAGPFLGNGVTTVFPFGFKVFKTSDVALTFTNANGADSVLTLDSDYSVVLNADQDNNPGGTITYPRVGSPLANLQTGEKLTATGSLAYTQPTDLPNLSPWFPEVVEDALDRAEIQIQQIKEITDRSLKIGVSDTPLTPLPAAPARANTVIGFDALGNVTVMPLPASVGAGDMRVDVFTAGVDFIAGVTTQLALSRPPGNPANLEIFFDALFQGTDQWSVNGQVVTFNSAIPVGVTKVFARIGTTLSTQIPPVGSVGDAQLVWTNILNRVVDSISSLRTLDKSKYNRAFVVGYYMPGDGGGGNYWYDPNDTTSADNGGAVIVAADGARWKLVVHTEVSVKQFGAKGDGVADDTTRIQAALDFVGSSRGLSLRFPAGKYMISAQLLFGPTPAAALPVALPGSDLHFSEHVESYIRGEGDARIIATAAMTRMLLLQFRSGFIGPFYTIVQGLLFDGANLATNAIESDYTMNLSILKNKLWRVVDGIRFTGYGVAKIRDNVIKASANCINLSGGGGDSDVSTNDLYPLTNGVGVRIGSLGGNAVIDRNVVNGEGNTGCIGVFLDGVGAGVSNSVINVRVTNNEFSGMVFGVWGWRHAAARNVWGVLVEANHTIPAAGGAVHTGNLVNFEGVDNATIVNNFINGTSLGLTLTADPGIRLADCKWSQVNGNKFGNLRGPAAYFIDCVNGEFCNNQISDVGQAGATGTCVDIDTGNNSIMFNDNVIRQSNVAFAQNPFFERAGANNNEFLRNQIFGCANRIRRVGAASVVAGRVVAQGSYSLAGAVATLQNNSHGFTVARTAAGVCAVTLATARPDLDYRVKVTADTPQVQADTFTANSFIVRTFNSAGGAVDANRVQIEVMD